MKKLGLVVPFALLIAGGPAAYADSFCVSGETCIQTLVSPVISDFTNAGHDHGDSDDGGAVVVSSTATTTDGVGVVAGTGVSVAERGNGAVHKTVFTFSAHSQTITDTGGAAGAHGSTKVYDFPAGVIQVLGVSCDLDTTAGVGGVADGAAVVEALGSATTGTGNSTLTGTEADFIASYAGTLTAGAGVFNKYASLVAAAFDGTSAAVALYLNAAVPDADCSANDTLSFSGTCTVVWSNLGDF